MYVTVVLSDRGVDAMQAGANPLDVIAHQAGGTVEPLHPGESAPDLRRYCVLEVPDGIDEGWLLRTLAESPDVEGAYVKPMGEPPGGMAPGPPL